MPIQAITTSATFQLKSSSAGYVQAINVSAPGTTWTVKLLDGPDSAGNTKTIFGGTTGWTATAGIQPVATPMPFTNGLQVVTAGTAGELEIIYQ
jgi:hypothetical protein